MTLLIWPAFLATLPRPSKEASAQKMKQRNHIPDFPGSTAGPCLEDKYPLASHGLASLIKDGRK
jgi:hypothetical protein